MKELSLWAKEHVLSARIIIILSSFLLAALGIVTGLLLRDMQVSIPALALIFFSLTFITGILFYPRKKTNRRRIPYRRQKTCDTLLTGSVFLMILFLGNHPRQILNYSSPFVPASASHSSLPKDSSFKTYKTVAAFTASMKDKDGKLRKWKERKKMLKEQVRAIKHAKEPSDGGKVALIALSVLVALGLIYLVAALSCSISCGGSGALAVIVAIGGTALVVFLLVVVIRRILGKKKRETRNPKPETSSN
ncbi:MAG TPA: hypothetical protein VMZ03_01610 [Chitinophagaceae bacterium]|nr:hypothetical protein [Chitinophagaceae bacterium]